MNICRYAFRRPVVDMGNWCLKTHNGCNTPIDVLDAINSTSVKRGPILDLASAQWVGGLAHPHRRVGVVTYHRSVLAFADCDLAARRVGRNPLETSFGINGL